MISTIKWLLWNQIVFYDFETVHREHKTTVYLEVIFSCFFCVFYDHFSTHCIVQNSTQTLKIKQNLFFLSGEKGNTIKCAFSSSYRTSE